MKIALAGASGFIGEPLKKRLRDEGHDLVVLVRRAPSAPEEVRWDPAVGSLDPDALKGVEAAVNLAGVGVADQRWSDAYKREIRDSRVESTLTLCGALARLDIPPRQLVQASGMDYYGDTGDALVDEGYGPGDGFLAEVCVEWEAATRPARDAGIAVAAMRTSMVLDPSGGSLDRLESLYRLGIGGPMGRGRMWWSWITLEDMVSAITWMLSAPGGDTVDTPVNLASPNPVRNADFSAALGRAVRRPALIPVPPPALRIVLGEFADTVLASHRLVPGVLLERGFSFAHPDIDSAFGAVLG